MNRVVALYGRADNLNIVFTKKGGSWQALVPPDLMDGRYVIELWAESTTGEIAYYLGVLYLTDSRAVYLEIAEQPYTVEITTNRYYIDRSVLEMPIKFCLGEEKYIDFKIKSKKNEPIIITEAKWYLKSPNEIVQEGNCNIVNDLLTILLKPYTYGGYYLEVEYHVGEEIRKERCMVQVD